MMATTRKINAHRSMMIYSSKRVLNTQINSAFKFGREGENEASDQPCGGQQLLTTVGYGHVSPWTVKGRVVAESCRGGTSIATTCAGSATLPAASSPG